jgi:hypothetical protein
VSAHADSSPAVARREAKSRAALHAAYREGLGLAAIVALREHAAARVVATSEMHAGAAVRDKGAVVAQFWCRRAADADRVALAATARLRGRESHDGHEGSSSSASAPAANNLRAVIEGAAKRLRIALYSDDEIRAEADVVIARVEAEIENLKGAGQLKSVNQSYRAYRLAASARGERAVPYADWFNKYKANLVHELAAALRYA